MAHHPIEELMKTTMTNLKQMVDVNTILGKPVSTLDGNVVLTVSKVAFGFGAGGSDFEGETQNHTHKSQQGKHEEKASDTQLPFGGGSGAGVSISPVAFLVVGANGVQVMHLHSNTHLIERAIEAAPQALQSVQNMMGNQSKKDGLR
ncbi:GerW family sporulation protein [Microbacteriaceae bacterium 4G12]